MNLNARRRLVQRLDVVILLGLLLTSGLAALFFSTQFYAAEDEATAQVSAPTATVTPTATFTATPTLTVTATRTATPTRTPPPSATVTPPPSATPWPTPEVSAPLPAYVGQAVVLTGQARPRDTIHVYDAQGQWLGGTLALADGRWALSLPPQSVAGTLELHLLAVGAEGAKSAPVIVRVDVRPVPSATPTHTPSATPSASPTPSATASYTPSATSTPTATLTATDTPTTTPSPTATHTATPSASPTPSATPTVTASATPRPTVTATPTLSPPSPQAVAQVPSPTPGVTATHTATPTRKPSPTPTPTVTPSSTYVPLAVPRIDDPASGAVYSPGALTVQGRASTGAEVTLKDAISGKVLGRAVADVSEWWKITATLDEEGEWALVAVVQSPDGTRLTSAPVRITIAPPLHPETGAVLTSTDPAASRRALTALLGLLLVAGGFSVFFAGRLVYLVARGRKRSS